ncbi:sigma-70 family RNA polymerase sigma factor [Lysobacter terrae]
MKRGDSGRLKVVASEGTVRQEAMDASSADPERVLETHELDWTILMARAQEGDGEAYSRLLQQITPYLRTLARRWLRDAWDIEDTVQDILLALHSVRHTYDPARPFGPWLAGVANRRAIDRLRRHGRLQARELPLTAMHEEHPAEDTDADGALERGPLDAAIDRLPSAQRKAIRMLKLEEKSLKQAAHESGMTVAALKVATHRAIGSLRRMLSGEDRT